jgi:hypothetical protein
MGNSKTTTDSNSLVPSTKPRSSSKSRSPPPSKKRKVTPPRSKKVTSPSLQPKSALSERYYIYSLTLVLERSDPEVIARLGQTCKGFHDYYEKTRKLVIIGCVSGNYDVLTNWMRKQEILKEYTGLRLGSHMHRTFFTTEMSNLPAGEWARIEHGIVLFWNQIPADFQIKSLNYWKLYRKYYRLGENGSSRDTCQSWSPSFKFKPPPDNMFQEPLFPFKVIRLDGAIIDDTFISELYPKYDSLLYLVLGQCIIKDTNFGINLSKLINLKYFGLHCYDYFTKELNILTFPPNLEKVAISITFGGFMMIDSYHCKNLVRL